MNTAATAPFHDWKYRMWAAGCKMPTQVLELPSRCFCGAEIGVACEEHVYASHMERPRLLGPVVLRA